MLAYLRKFALQSSPPTDLNVLIERLRWMLDVWDTAMGKTGTILKASEPFISRMLSVPQGQEPFKTARAFYLSLSPLEFFIIGLEEFIDDAFRDVVTRCGMSYERIVNELLREVDGERMVDPNVKFNSRAGFLQRQLLDRRYNPAERFCSTMLTVYDIRNQRGPHDVPTADELEAKFCVSSFP